MQKVTPWISGQPQVPPSKEFGQNPKDFQVMYLYDVKNEGR